MADRIDEGLHIRDVSTTVTTRGLEELLCELDGPRQHGRKKTTRHGKSVMFNHLCHVLESEVKPESSPQQDVEFEQVVRHYTLHMLLQDPVETYCKEDTIGQTGSKCSDIILRVRKVLTTVTVRHEHYGKYLEECETINNWRHFVAT